MEYFGVFAPSADSSDAENMVFENKDNALKMFKTYKDARFKSFKTRGEALKFAKNGANPGPSLTDSTLLSPPPNQPPMKNPEKSNFPSLKPQDMIKFRKEIEQNNVPKVYEMICTNPRYLVSSGDTPSILKEGTRYNALHVAAINKLDKMAMLILQTVEQTQFIELLYGFKDHPNVQEMSTFLLKSYLNTPDKSRNETPLHFASKLGAAKVVKVLVSYPLCEMKPNNEGLYPKDIIGLRASDMSAEDKKAIEELLNERYFVPVLRSIDNSALPTVGEPFTPSNMPKFNQDPLSPTVEIKAYAGPMSLEKALKFHKRMKTPPRLVPSAPPNTSGSPQGLSISTPYDSPRSTKSATDLICSTPKHKKKLFDGTADESTDSDNCNDKNGNLKVAHNISVLGEHEEEEYKELFNDLLESRIEMEKENMFMGYREPRPILETPMRGKHDSNSNHLNHNYNSHERNVNSNDSLFCNVRSGSSGTLMTYLDESGSTYDSSNVYNSPSFKEKHLRLTDINKGLEKIGRELACENKVDWKEYWDFLERYVDIASDEGLACFENYLKRKEKIVKTKESTASPELSPNRNKLNESFGLGAICAGFYSLDLNDEISDKSKLSRNGLASPSTSISRIGLFNDFAQSTQAKTPLSIPYVCIEQNFRAFAKRLANLLESEIVQDQHSYEKMLLQEINRLNTSISNYKHDSRFNVVNFQKVHARYSFLLVWYLKKNNSNVKYLRNTIPLISKVYSLATQYATPSSFASIKETSKIHAVCVSQFISEYIEKQEKIFNPENVETETACVDAWNGPDIVECSCQFGPTPSNSKNRREIRKKLISENSSRASLQDLWAPRKIEASDEDDDSFLSCGSDVDSDSDEYLTPLSTTPVDSDEDELIPFEESLENLEDDKEFLLFIVGDQPTQTDIEVFKAMGEHFSVNGTKYPLVSKWYTAMNRLHSKACHISVKNFRLFTPKLKMKSGLFHS